MKNQGHIAKAPKIPETPSSLLEKTTTVEWVNYQANPQGELVKVEPPEKTLKELGINPYHRDKGIHYTNFKSYDPTKK